jgi:hypothetical protein
VGAGLRDARIQRYPRAWATLTACHRQLAAISGGEPPDIPSQASYLSPRERRRFRTWSPPSRTFRPCWTGPAVFMAGGITGCPDFQSQVTAALADDHVVLFNPRRSRFDLTDPDATAEQVQWEYDHRTHDALAYMLFWFPAADSPQPIAMLELGDALARADLPIVVGADRGFPRYRDVVLQCRAARPALTVHTDLASSAAIQQAADTVPAPCRGHNAGSRSARVGAGCGCHPHVEVGDGPPGCRGVPVRPDRCHRWA